MSEIITACKSFNWNLSLESLISIEKIKIQKLGGRDGEKGLDPLGWDL